MATEKQIDDALASLAVAYPHYDKQQANPTLARKIFHRVLRDVDGSLLEAAYMQWLSTARPFHPSPGELRDLALTLTERGNGDKSADEAWSEVIGAARNVGSYGVPTWSSEAIAKTMQAFGYWKDFCQIENDQLPTVRAQFLRIYEAQRLRRHDAALMLPEVQSVIGRLAETKRKEIEAHQ